MNPGVLAIVGTGRHGSALARLAVAAGMAVRLANSRGPHTLAALVGELGPSARAGTVDEVAAESDIVIVTLPLHRIDALPESAFAGKTVVDATNYYPDWNGPFAELDDGQTASSRLVQRRLSGAMVVKSLNTIDFRRLPRRARPTGDPERSALPVAGDRADAVESVVMLLDCLGFDALVVGGLDDSQCIQPGSPAYGDPYRGIMPAGADRAAWFAETPGVPVPVATLRELVAGAASPFSRTEPF
ncbi:hypothetical protein FB384_004455 [Prauserella sediminis]|uniref:Pyrroline-5-carboxylate reductase catalytic N-terminal domain-containing protein n=1 Tax=Prauserella sediminis TaxID=577680 RepID=A0A839XWQ4_9PSEU|nr:NAD(P)-binding domain-containing protein [Prauserella sediminis]MBB3665498.1 hypothetical protein [Prauserella sediminis]